jgi:hypothetical protein
VPVVRVEQAAAVVPPVVPAAVRPEARAAAGAEAVVAPEALVAAETTVVAGALWTRASRPAGLPSCGSGASVV